MIAFQELTNDKAYLLNLHVHTYYRSMLGAIEENETYLSRDQLLDYHEQIKGSVVNEVGI